MSRCPFCDKELVYINYSSYYDPPEWYERCGNYKCGKYEMNYFYYDGYYLKLDKWERKNVEDGSPIMEEFYLRLRYYNKKKK